MYAFVLMPFSNRYDDLYKYGIKDAAEREGFAAERCDEQFFSEGMLRHIYNQIDSADLIIAVMSGQNPNVFYEVGFAHAKDKLCFLLTENADDIPFDLKHHLHIIYGTSISKLNRELRNNLRLAKAALNGAQSSLAVEMRWSRGTIQSDDFYDLCRFDFTVDIKNTSLGHHVNVDRVYVYTPSGWKLTGTGSEFASTASDAAGFNLRHLAKSSTDRLEKRAGWTQLSFVGTRLLDQRTRREATAKEYNVTAEMMVRLISDGKTFDFPLSLKADISHGLY